MTHAQSKPNHKSYYYLTDNKNKPAVSVSPASAMTSFLEQFQQIFSCCCRGDEVLETRDEGDSDSRSISIVEEKESPRSSRPGGSSLFYRLYPNFASYVVEPEDFDSGGKVMSPFDLPLDLDDDIREVKRYGYGYGQGDDWDKYR